jgi:3-methyl-2-oxobutanoate hydroxymethyltransferase
MTLPDFAKKKQAGEKIAMVTCYDSTSARIVDTTATDCILVGDSLGMTMMGLPSTVPVTMEMMVLATAAVVRGAPNTFVVGDMPFASYRKSLTENVEAAALLMQAGAQAVKLEGAAGNLDTIRHYVDSGIPVMGHLGLTPQSVHQLGGYRVQGKTEAAAQRLIDDCLALEKAGCFAVVLECVPAKLAAEITRKLTIPTIGIGAGRDTDGQVLVFQDLLGLNTAFKPKFVKHFADGATFVAKALNTYADDVKTGKFPADENCF